MKQSLLRIFTVIIFALTLGFTVSAENLNSVTIRYNTDDGFLQNVQFDLYRLGDISGSIITPESELTTYSVSFDISDSEKLTALAETIGAYILRDKITPDYSDTTDENGIADFNNVKLKDGAYLYIGKKHTQNGYIYFCEPAIVLLENGANLTVAPKYEKTDSTTDIKVEYKVIKAWYTDEDGERKAVEIEVQLLCDGEVYDTVTLNESNNWKHEWKSLSSHYSWTITEKYIPEGFIAKLKKDSGVFMLSNISDTTETTTTAETTTEPETTTTADLPQTGSLSWPIPYLVCIGLLLLTAGYAIYRRNEIKDEQQ